MEEEKKKQTTISIWPQTRTKLEQLRAHGEREYHSWDEFFEDIVEFVSKKLKLVLN